VARACISTRAATSSPCTAIDFGGEQFEVAVAAATVLDRVRRLEFGGVLSDVSLNTMTANTPVAVRAATTAAHPTTTRRDRLGGEPGT
jgi:hypothetical protein